jgi:hypothetical protein
MLERAAVRRRSEANRTIRSRSLRFWGDMGGDNKTSPSLTAALAAVGFARHYKAIADSHRKEGRLAEAAVFDGVVKKFNDIARVAFSEHRRRKGRNT